MSVFGLLGAIITPGHPKKIADACCPRLRRLRRRPGGRPQLDSTVVAHSFGVSDDPKGIRSLSPPLRFGGLLLPPGPPCNGWQEHHDLAVLQWGVDALQEPDVLVPHVEVDEAADLAVVVEDPLEQLRVVPTHLLEQLLDTRSVHVQLGRPTGELAELGGDLQSNTHRIILPW